jgi:putative chitinase
MRLSDFDNTTRGLTIFDIDDTLFHTTAKIKVKKDGKIVRSLTNQEFNNYKLLPGEEFDFGEFSSAEKFNKESKPIKPMIDKLKNILANAGNSKVIMLTARADFDNRDLFLNTFAKYGIDMSQVHVHRAGNLPGDAIPAEKKAVWVRRYLDTGKFNRVSLYDDSMSNLRVFNSLRTEYPTVAFQAIFVKSDGGIKIIKEEYLDSMYEDFNTDRISEKVGDVVQPVEPGDTVYSIARQNNLDPIELMKFNGFTKDTKLKLGQEVKIPQKNSTAPTTPSKKSTPAAGQGAQPTTITGSSLETTLRSFAIQAGLGGQELAQFLAQCAHETGNFSSLTEYGGSLDFRKYDPKYAPKKAKELGNVRPGDGALFKGRGFIQLTGRWNYTEAGKALGLPLDQNPTLVERPEIAAKTSLWFWKNRVRPNVDNFSDTKSVTYYINKALRGLAERAKLFQSYLQTMQKSVKEVRSEEDYHPNARPRGPETKPTMPAGTVRVDVDDVYDWYKLGQHISNMKGLGKHDFGKGPPSTIFSFGSEEEEHKYIKDLERTGLTTTDIDPADSRQPKGMKRQKVDPTYSVDEAKKRRRKVRRAAYGPGPFGGYGYAVGYSGDGGSGGEGGGVGENFVDSEVKDNEPSPEFVEAVENWQEMWNTDEAAKIILNSPESRPFRTPPIATKLYRAVVPKDRELNSIKANGSVVAFATKLDGAINFVQTLETMDEWVIIEKPFNPSGFLLNYTAMIEHYKLSDFDRYVDEAEVWMKPGPQYSGVKKSEVVLTSQQYYSESVNENFADGKNPGRKGLAKRVGVNTKASVSDLRKTAKNSSGEKARMAHWLANMKSGRKNK